MQEGGVVLLDIRTHRMLEIFVVDKMQVKIKSEVGFRIYLNTKY